MLDDSVRQLLSESAQKTLETMFFMAPDGISAVAERPAGPLIAASLLFNGTPPGRFGIVISTPVARTLAASFLGFEEEGKLPLPQVGGVIGELANMICGAVLSELESNCNFDLTTPAPVMVGADDPGPDYSTGSPVVCRFEVPDGAIVLSLAFGEEAA
jgi:CheY-specific phosphatase CheX